MSPDEKWRLDKTEIEKVLSGADSGVLSMCVGGEPYAVPLSYAFLEGKIVIHCAPKGKKLEFLRANPRVCFVVSKNQDGMKPHCPDEECNYHYESVICEGTARIVESVSEKLELLEKFKEYFYARLGRDPKTNPVAEKAAAHATCIVIKISEMTGKRK
jgi:uncharacterized protein